MAALHVPAVAAPLALPTLAVGTMRWLPQHHKRPYRMALRSVEEWNDEHRMDDVVVNDVHMFRLEQMDKRNWWMCCYLDDSTDQRLTFEISFNKKTREIEVHVTEYPDGEHVYEGDDA